MVSTPIYQILKIPIDRTTRLEVSMLRMRDKTLHIPEDLHAELRIKAATERSTITEIAILAIRCWLARTKKPVTVKRVA